jgi:hypothetical protein
MLERTSGQKLSRKDMRLLRYGNLCNNFSKIAIGLAASDKANEIGEKHLRAMEKELADLKRPTTKALKRRRKEKVQQVPVLTKICRTVRPWNKIHKLLLIEERETRWLYLGKEDQVQKGRSVDWNFKNLRQLHLVFVRKMIMMPGHVKYG